MTEIGELRTPPSRQTTLRPYGPQFRPPAALRLALLGGLMFFCFCYGVAWAVFAPFLMVALTVPVVVMGAVAIWALPDSGKAPSQLLDILFFASFIALVMWPNYLAVALPGLPWITVNRLIGVPFVLTLLVYISTSQQFRVIESRVLAATPLLSQFLAIFVLLQAASLAFSIDKGLSVDRFINDQTGWTATFVASCYVFSKPGRAETWAGILCSMAVALGGLALWEHRLNHPPWFGHIPAFLTVSDESVQRILAGSARMGSKQSRAQGTFSTALGFSEYMALATPFALHFLANSYRPPVRIAACFAALAAIYGAVLSQGRTGLVGILLAVLLYPLAWAFLYWRSNRASLAASAVVFTSPGLFVAGVSASFVVPGLRYRIWSGGATQYSNQSRIDQWRLGIPKILSHPWGYGLGRGAATVNYHSPGGGLTIDSYTLRLFIEYGVLGAALFYIAFAIAIAAASGALLKTSIETKETKLLLPVAISLLGYLIMKSVFAQEDNMPIVATLLGLLFAIRYRDGLRAARSNEFRIIDSARFDPVTIYYRASRTAHSAKPGISNSKRRRDAIQQPVKHRPMARSSVDVTRSPVRPWRWPRRPDLEGD